MSIIKLCWRSHSNAFLSLSITINSLRRMNMNKRLTWQNNEGMALRHPVRGGSFTEYNLNYPTFLFPWICIYFFLYFVKTLENNKYLVSIYLIIFRCLLFFLITQIQFWWRHLRKFFTRWIHPQTFNIYFIWASKKIWSIRMSISEFIKLLIQTLI